eukprot:scaffold8079_cov69-Skeletonema_dohrnii-CCMP3373.AAC.5
MKCRQFNMTRSKTRGVCAVRAIKLTCCRGYYSVILALLKVGGSIGKIGVPLMVGVSCELRFVAFLKQK